MFVLNFRGLAAANLTILQPGGYSQSPGGFVSYQLKCTCVDANLTRIVGASSRPNSIRMWCSTCRPCPSIPIRHRPHRVLRRLCPMLHILHLLDIRHREHLQLTQAMCVSRLKYLPTLTRVFSRRRSISRPPGRTMQDMVRHRCRSTLPRRAFRASRPTRLRQALRLRALHP